ncbi:MAG: hypothetical protein PHH75_02400 [Candidatus Omnitrophica bacterium]|nr:hypothetical protein [Candidatus Omnitrophota bacterium]
MSPRNGNAAEHITEARETNPVDRKITSQDPVTARTRRKKFSIKKEKAIKTPRLVAIPLPPLKPRNSVQLWPETVQTAARHK